MDSWDTANLVLGCFCIVLSFLPTGYLISNNRYKRKLYLYSLLICVANIGMALGGLPEYLMDAVVEAGERRVLLLGGTLYYGAFTCLLFFFLQYFFEYLQLSGRERQLCSVGAFSMTGLLLLLTLASPWTGAAFTVDEDGLQMGPWFPLLQSVVLLCYLFVTIVILRHRSVLRRREFVFLLLYILIPLAGGLSRIVLPNIVLVNAGFTVATLLILMNVQFEHEVMLKEQEKQLAEGRIDIMLSQIQPHFLYNSLGVIYSLCATDPEAARKAIKRFSDFLRGNMDSLKNREPIPFEAELNHVMNYLYLEQQRFGEMLSQFLVTAVQNHIVLGVGQRSRLAVVRDQQPCNTAEEVKSVDMAVQPVLGFHVLAGFRIGVVAAGQNGNKQISGTLFPGNRVLDGNGISGPIYLHGISRLVLDAHGRFCNACPAAVPLAKLSTHVRPLARLLTLRAVFFP